MKICIWYSMTDNPYGGANSFLKALKTYLTLKGHQVIDSPSASADVILVNSWSMGSGAFLSPDRVAEVKKYGCTAWYRKHLPFLKIVFARGKRKGPPIIHRLDGIAALYGRHDDSDATQIMINEMADYTIFQSEFCRQSFANAGVKPMKSSVIFNGVDNLIYYPGRKKNVSSGNLKALAVSWSDNRKKGFSALTDIAALSGIELTFIGNWCKSVPNGKVRLLGAKPASEIAGLMRQNDIFVHAAENDPCPNVVLEALACGLPVLYKDSGGTSELAKGYGVPLDEGYRRAIAELRERYSETRENILQNLHSFSIEYAAEKYLAVIEQAVQRV